MVNKPHEKEKYSFSRLSSWWVCPYGWKLNYIDGHEGIGNAFSSYGTLIHSILERYAKGELALKELPETFEWEFPAAVEEEFPPNKYVDLKTSYYEQGLNFLTNFSGYDKYKILGVEEEFKIDIDDWIFHGFIDIHYLDEDGRLIVRDYKSKASFKSKEEQKEYARQLYLYSAYIKQKYGKFPDELQFLMFRKQSEPVRIQFDEGAYDEAFSWARYTVEQIREAFDYPPKCDSFYCANLCNHREYCDLRERFN